MVSLEKEMEEFAKPIHDSQKGFSATRKDIQHLKEVILCYLLHFIALHLSALEGF